MSQSESQTSLLEDVRSWSADTCKTRLTDTLPKLVRQYCNGGSAGIKASVLRVMVDAFLPCLDLQCLEEEFFSRVLPQTCQLFDDTLLKVSSTVDGTLSKDDSCQLKEKLQTLLQISLDVLECLGSCVSYVVNMLCGGALSIDTVRSLPSSVLHVVRGSFHHCKDSTAMYGDHFPLVSDILSSLFKKAYSLQKSLTVLLDAVQLTLDDGEDCVEAVFVVFCAAVCNGFHDLCVVIGNMDSTLLVSTWRFLVKTTCKHKGPLKNVLQMHPIVATLCSDIRVNYEQCLRLAPHPPSSQSSQGGDEKAFAKTLKICSLLVKMLTHLLKEFDGYLGPCLTELYNLVVVLQSRAPPSIHAPTIFSSARDEIDRSLLVCVEPVLQQLVDNPLFSDAVTALKQDIPSDLQFGRLLTLVKILRILPSRQEQTKTAWMVCATSTWEEPRESILHALFRAYSNCYVELALPVKISLVVSPGEPQRDVSLREYLTVHLCGFVASVSTQHFGAVERCLLENVVSSELNSALLAMDVWCFLARYSTAELCASHVQLLADLLALTPVNHSPGYIHLGMLLWRLVPLMAQDQQAELPTRYPPKEHSSLWSHLPLPAFQEDTRKAIAEDLVCHGLAECDAWLNSKEHTFGSLKQLETALMCISNVYRQFENASPPISKQFSQSVVEMVVELWEELPLDKVKSHDIFSCLIDISGLILAELQPRDFGKVVHHLRCVPMSDATVKVRLGVVNFLHRTRKVKVQNCFQLTDILNVLAELFSAVLRDRHCIVRQLALQSFSAFAEETAHESVVPECLHDETTHGRVVDFLNKIPQECTPAARTEVEWLQQQATTLLQHVAAHNSGHEEPHPRSVDGECESSQPHVTDHDGSKSTSNIEGATTVEHSNQPAAKRPKIEGSEELYRQAISGIQSHLQTIQELKDRGQGSPPSWVKTELNMLRDRIVNLIQDS